MKWYWGALAGLLLLVGAYAKGCTDERGKINADAKAKIAQQDSALSHLRDTLFLINAERSRLAYNARQSEAEATEARRLLDAQRGNLGRLRHRSDSLAQQLAEAKSPTDSLRGAMVVIDALTSERDSLTDVVQRATQTITAQVKAFADLKLLQQNDSTKADLHARQRDAYLAQRNDEIRQRIAAQRGFSLKLKVGAGAVLAGVATVLILTR